VDPDELPATTSAGPHTTGLTTRQIRLLAIAIALFILSTIICSLAGLWRGYIDLQVYRNGARVWLDGGNLYGPIAKVYGLELPFTYPPLAALFFAPLAVMHLYVAESLVLALSIAILGMTVWLVSMQMRPRMATPTRLALVIGAVALLGLSEPIRQTYNFGQINLFLMAAVVLDALIRKPFWPRGMLIGIALSIKLTPGGFLLYFLMRRDWRAALTVVVSALVAVVVGFTLFPHDSSQYWFHTMLDTGRIGPPSYPGNQSLKGFMFRLGLPASAATTVWIVLSLITIALAAVLMARLLRDAAQAESGGGASEAPTWLREQPPPGPPGAPRNDPADAESIAPGAPAARIAALTVNAAAILLVSPVSWSHHWVWVALAALVVADAIDRGGRNRSFLLATAAITVMFMVGPQWLLPHRNGLEHHWSLWEQLIGSSYVLVTFAVLAVATVAYRPIYRTATGLRNAASAAE
jgi:alpha-1,2-mannosyltransferase